MSNCEDEIFVNHVLLVAKQYLYSCCKNTVLSCSGGGAFMHPGATPQEFYTCGLDTVKNRAIKLRILLLHRGGFRGILTWILCQSGLPARAG